MPEGLAVGLEVGLAEVLLTGCVVLVEGLVLGDGDRYPGCVEGLLVGWVAGRVVGCVEGLLVGWVDGRVEGLVAGRVAGCVEGLLAGRVAGLEG